MTTDHEQPPIGDLSALGDAIDQDPMMTVVCHGPDHRIVAINAPGRAAVPGRDILGVPYRESTPEIIEQGWEEIFDRVYATGQGERYDGWRTQLVHDDGSTTAFWLDFWVHPLTDGPGEVIGIWLRMIDVSERVLAAETAATELRELSVRFEQAIDVVDSFQRALLPDKVPVLPSVALAAHHLLAADETVAGGDWFDVVTRPGHVILVVGDVVGHGVEAAATMGQQRAVLLDRLEDGAAIAEAVAALDRRACRVAASFGTTVCVVDLDVETGDLSYVTAGHPPPLVLDGDEDRFLEPSGAGPLGAAGDVTAAHDQLGADGSIVLYTDGIVELPRTTPAPGTVQLARTGRAAAANTLLPVGAPALAVERISSQVIEALTRKAGYTDDVTVLAAQRVSPPEAVKMDIRADDAAALAARRAVGTWLAGLDVCDEVVQALAHTVVELVQNVVDHAYERSADAGSVRLRATVDGDGWAVLEVSDDGAWRDAPPVEGRGLGLALARSFVDDLAIDPASPGTTVTARRRLGRSAGPLAPDAPVTPPPDREVFDVWQHHSDGCIVVGTRGPLDAAAVPDLRSHIDIATAANQPATRLDLTNATLLSSAVVHLILRARAATPTLEILAPIGSVAQHVLSLVAVEHSTVA